MLSTAFETLGDADRQFNYLSTLNRASAGGAQGKKHKNRSAAEFQADSQRRKKTAAAPGSHCAVCLCVHRFELLGSLFDAFVESLGAGPKWWENKSWPDIEAEIRRMEVKETRAL